MFKTQTSTFTSSNTRKQYVYIESPHIPNIFAASVSSESKRLTNLLRSLLFGDVSESNDVSSLVSKTLLLFRRFL